MKYKYNVVSIYTAGQGVEKYTELFERNGIEFENNFKTAWDYFTTENPGTSSIIKTTNGRSVYDAVEVLKENGLYFAQTRES